MTDFIFMGKYSSYMFVTGPDVVKTVTNEVVTQEELGGAVTHTTKSGVADLAFENDIEALLAARDFLDFLPLLHKEAVPERRPADSWDRIEESLEMLITANAHQQLGSTSARADGCQYGLELGGSLLHKTKTNQ